MALRVALFVYGSGSSTAITSRHAPAALTPSPTKPAIQSRGAKFAFRPMSSKVSLCGWMPMCASSSRLTDVFVTYTATTALRPPCRTSYWRVQEDIAGKAIVDQRW